MEEWLDEVEDLTGWRARQQIPVPALKPQHCTSAYAAHRAQQARSLYLGSVPVWVILSLTYINTKVSWIKRCEQLLDIASACGQEGDAESC